MIVTPRTTLVVAPIPFLHAMVAGDRRSAGAVMGLAVPDDWPGDADAIAGLPIHLDALARDPTQLPWRIRLIVADAHVIGSINLKGPPSSDHSVEIGWGLVPAVRGAGYATEAARAVIDWVFRSSSVRRIMATIPTKHAPSEHVAQRLGMRLTAERHRELPIWTIDRRADVRAPDVRAPDVRAPDVRAPDVRAPDDRAPDRPAD